MIEVLERAFTLEAGTTHLIWVGIFAVLSIAVRYLWNKTLTLRKKFVFYGSFLFLGLICSVTFLSIFPSRKPAFRAVFYYSCLTEIGKDRIIIPTIKIFNQGSPSVIHDWVLSVRGFKGERAIALNMPQTGDFVFTDTSTSKTTFYVTNSIQEKTKYQPIATGGMVDGHVMFALTNANRDFLLTFTTVYELSFKDVFNKSYKVTFHSEPPPARP